MEFPACALAHILFKFISLRASMKRAELDDPAAILQRLCLIEGDLLNWLEALPHYWTFTTKTSSERAATVFGGQLHTYRNIWISRTWSHFRWTRILVHETIQQQLAVLPVWSASDFPGLQLESVTILRQMATDICVSVPFHLCSYNPQTDQTVPRPEIMGSFDLLWPLTVVAGSEYVSDDMQAWVIELLEGIGHTMGIKHAFVLASTAKERRQRAAGKAIERDSC
jgi:hypothetical protein